MSFNPSPIGVNFNGSGDLEVTVQSLVVEDVGTNENVFVVWHPTDCRIDHIIFTSPSSVSAHQISGSNDWVSAFQAPSSEITFVYTICATPLPSGTQKCHDPEIDNVNPPGGGSARPM